MPRHVTRRERARPGSAVSSCAGSLASTGVTLGTVAALAAALTATGWVAYRRGRTLS
ncbi:hypothetical protein [Streptomyces sp. P17]|uniref:hypothetical protein n=1 Tax=Streptomyces sp. P17 TaxID=3074716 RepID=UPI0028F442C8|nr:hypothetical protein [Streptomyces sp. P17]MDT9695388.1 hypothetical protein [Streptomyces sp. P17]